MPPIMLRKTFISLGSAWGLGLLILALWAWRNDETLATYLGAHNLRVATWAVRCTAISLLAAGEAFIALLVLGNIWRRDWFTNALGLSAALVFMLSTASAVALGLAGR
jgi:hypothetical protein